MTRGLGSGSPIARRTVEPRRCTSASATRGTTTASAISAPSGVRKLRSTVPAAGRAGAGAARALAARRRIAARGGLRRQQPLAALQHQLEVVLRVVVVGVEADRLLEARDRGDQELGAVLLLCPLRRGRVPGDDADDAEQARGAGAEDRIGVVDDDRLEPLGELGAVDRQHRVGHRVVEQLAQPQQRAASPGRRCRPGRRARARRRRTAPAPVGLQPRRRRAGGETDVVGRNRLVRARDVDRDECKQDGADDAGGGDDEQQLARQVWQPPPHATAFRRGSAGSASRPA